MKNNEYYLISAVDDNVTFENALKDAICRLIGQKYWEDFYKYHFGGLEDSLCKSINKAIYNGKIDKEKDEYVFNQNGIRFEVTGHGYSLPPKSYDIIMTIQRDDRDYISNIHFERLTTRVRKEEIKFAMQDTFLKKEDWKDSEWKTIETLFGFECADTIRFDPIMVTGYGVPLKSKED